GLFGSGTRNYIAIVFTPTSTQSYSFGQTTAPVDTVMAIYDGAFDPTSPSTNQVAIIDDSHDASTCGGVQGFCPRVSADLEVGQPVTIVITTFSQNVPLGLPQNLYTTGPGVFAGSVIDPNTLDEGESATDEFTYVVTDGDATDTGTVTVTINGVNDAPVAVADTASIAEDTAAGVVVNVVANDTDVDVEPLTVSGVTNGTYGTVTYSGGTVTYTLNNANPAVQALGTGESMTDTFTYTVTDGTADDDGTVTITITGVNDAPVAADDAFFVTEDGTVTFTVAGLTGNDFDAEGDPLTVGVGQPGNGTLSFSGGVYTYTPAAVTQALDTGDSATETFNYLVSDGNGGFDSASITITITGVNDAPVANPDHAGTVSEDSSTPLTYDVVANDTDVDDEPLAVSAVSNGSHGSVTFSGGSITYTLNNSDPVVQALGVGESLTDTFTYTVGDGTATAIGTVTVTVTGVNDAPVITVVDAGTPDSVTGIINGSVTATDADGDTLTYGLPVTETTYGSVSINPQTGAFVYTPDVPVPSSAIPGTDFEDGTLAGWNVGPQTGIFDPTVDNVGDGVSVTSGSLTFSSPASDDGVPARSWVYTPDGHAAAISPTEAQTFAQAGTALGLTVIQQQAIIATSAGTIQDAAWISKTVHLEADKTYTMSWNYISTDYQPYNDGSITTLVYQGSGPAPTTYVNNSEGNYAILGYTNTGTGDYSTGSYGSTGWQTSTYRVSQTGDYTLGFAVFNLRDTAYDPILLVDDQGGTTLRDGQPYAPVPPNSPTAPRTVDDTFTVTVSDGNGGSVDTDVTVQVTIIPASQTPTV
ncbi:MAG: Ig-like domain-containing protein, partial [Mycobacterium sp.]